MTNSFYWTVPLPDDKPRPVLWSLGPLLLQRWPQIRWHIHGRHKGLDVRILDDLSVRDLSPTFYLMTAEVIEEILRRTWPEGDWRVDVASDLATPTPEWK